MKELSIRFGGEKLRMRLMKRNEVIKDGDLCAFVGDKEGEFVGSFTEDSLKELTYKRSTQVGERVWEFPSWAYFRVLSKFWK